MAMHKKTNLPLSWRIWGAIRCFQIFYGISDDTLCEYLNVTKPTLRGYDEDPSKLTLAKLDRLREAIGPMIDLM